LEEAEIRLKQILEDLGQSFIDEDEDLVPIIREDLRRR